MPSHRSSADVPAWVASSRVVASIAPIARESLLVAGVVVAARAIAGVSRTVDRMWHASIVGRMLRPAPADDGAAIELVSGSAMHGSVERVFAVVRVARQSSWIRLTLKTTTFSDSPTDRVRWYGWAMLGASVTRIAIAHVTTLFTPVPTGVGWLLVVPAAVLCVVRPNALVAAWRTRSCRTGMHCLNADHRNRDADS